MSDYGSKQGKATSPELQALALRVAALERDSFQRGKDVVIGGPKDTARQSTRQPRLILVDPATGTQYVFDVSGGVLSLNPL